MAPQDLVFFVFAGLAAWFLLIRPQRARARALQEVREALVVGSRVVTTAGLHATVAELDGDTVLLEIAPGVRARFSAGAVVRVLSWSVVLRLVVVPAATVLTCRLLGLSGSSAVTVVVFAALPTASSSYVLARRLGGDAPLMANITATQTAVAFLTLPAWILLSQALL